jgi:formate dehydrogenase subunit gamma
MEAIVTKGLTEAMPSYGLWGLAGTIVMLVFFALLRGRVGIEAGWGGWTIRRFGAFERLVHWVLALSFIILALSGLTGLYGDRILLPLVGADVLAAMRLWSKLAHSHAAFPFMAALAIAFLLWVGRSLPHWRDVIWLAMGGGLLLLRWRPAAWKFNAGQKLFFWVLMLGGLSLSLTGLALTYSPALMSKTIALLNSLGLRLPSNLAPAEELQLALVWHTALALVLTCLVVVHIYLRTWGIQGAFSAMSSGTVDVNWAKQHHSLWAVREMKHAEEASTPASPAASMAPAE